MTNNYGRVPLRACVLLWSCLLAFASVIHAGAVVPPADSILRVISGDGQPLVPGVPSAPLVVRLSAADGTPIGGMTVNWVASPGATNSMATPVTTTAADGTTSNTITAGIPDNNVRAIATVQTAGAPLNAIFNFTAGIQNRGDLTDQQRSVANSVDVACPTLAGMDPNGLNAAQMDFLGRCTELVVDASDPTTPDALQELATEETSSMGRRATDATRATGANVSARMGALRHAAGTHQGGVNISGFGVDLSGLSFVDGDQVLPGSMVHSLLPSWVLNADNDTGELTLAKAGIWVRGTFVTGDQKRSANEPGFDFDTFALSLGFDYRFTRNAFWGFAWSYADVDSDLNAQQGTLDSDGNAVTLYGGWQTTDRLAFDGAYTFGRLDHDFRRRIDYTTACVAGLTCVGGAATTDVDQFALSNPESEDQSLNLGVYYDWTHGASTWSGYFRASWLKIEIDGYTEQPSDPTGAGFGMMAAVQPQDIDSAVSIVGISWTKAFSKGWGVLIPNISVEWFHEFKNDARPVGAVFVNDPTGTPFFFVTDGPDPDYGNIGAGFSLVFAGGKTAWFYYDGLVAHNQLSRHALTAGIRFEF